VPNLLPLQELSDGAPISSPAPDLGLDTVHPSVPFHHPPSPSAIEVDTIETEYHLHTGKPLRRETLDDYRQCQYVEATKSVPAASGSTLHQPWYPFATCADFEFSELSLNASLSRKEISDFLALLHRCQSGVDQVTFRDYKHLHDTWNEASHLLTPVCCCLHTRYTPHHSFRALLL
jgi:hypothetical protein